MKYSIGQFSKLINISEYTLRYYENEKLITPDRDNNGRRYYNDSDISWIEFIKRLKDTGMPIKEIRKYAELRSAGDSTLQERMDLLIKHQDTLQRKISELIFNNEKLNEKIDYYRQMIDKQKNGQS